MRYPSHALIRAVFTPAGTGGPDGPLHADTFIMDSYNFMTPVTEGQTRYYWFQLRNIRPEDAALSKMMSEDVPHAFEEDRDVLNAVQIGMASKISPHIDLPIHPRRAAALSQPPAGDDQRGARTRPPDDGLARTRRHSTQK